METSMPRPIPNFDGEQIVRLGKSDVRLRDVPVGKEFVLDGAVYQTSVSPTQFGSVPLLTSFRAGISWYMRSSETTTYALDGNTPFSKIDIKSSKYFGATERVAVLEITRRGDAPAESQTRSASAA